MKNNITKEIELLINKLEDRKKEADEMCEINYKCGHYGIGGIYKERSKAYDFCILKLLTILNPETVTDATI